MRVPALALGPALVLTMAAAVSPAEAQIVVSRAPAVAPDLGKVIAGSSATTFSVTVQGGVTQTSGNAIRLSNASVTPPTISLTCPLLSPLNLCVLRSIQVTIQPAGGSAPASITMLRVASLSGATFKNGPPTDATSITFILNPMGVGTTTFKLGMDVLLAANAASGQTLFNYTVTATFL